MANHRRNNNNNQPRDLADWIEHEFQTNPIQFMEDGFTQKLRSQLESRQGPAFREEKRRGLERYLNRLYDIEADPEMQMLNIVWNYSNPLKNMRLFLANDTPLPTSSTDKMTMIQFALTTNRHEAMDEFVQHGMSLDGYTVPFYTLAHAGDDSKERIEWIQYMMEKGMDLNDQNEEGETLLQTLFFHLFPEEDRAKEDILFEVAQFLLENGAEPNLQDRRGSAALFYAIQRPRFLRLLLDHGANPNLLNNRGHSPFSAFLRDYEEDPDRYDENTYMDIFEHLKRSIWNPLVTVPSLQGDQVTFHELAEEVGLHRLSRAIAEYEEEYRRTHPNVPVNQAALANQKRMNALRREVERARQTQKGGRKRTRKGKKTRRGKKKTRRHRR